MATRRILAVDDSVSIRKSISFILGQEDFEVVEAENGADGLTKAKGEKFGLIITDINMPIMDGIETLVKIKEFDPGAKVIMVTAAGQKHKMLEAIKLGAAEFVTKPFETDQIISILESIE